MKRQVSALSVLVALVFASVPAVAQGPNSIPARLAALEARIAKLESGQVDAADLVGTYTFYVFGTYLSASDQQISAEMTVGTITLNADGTGSGTFTDSGYALHVGSPVLESWAEGGEDAITWSVVDGKLVVPGAFTAEIGAGGRVLIAGGTGLKGDGWNNIGFLIRQPNP
jgi:hypothetical protein